MPETLALLGGDPVVTAKTVPYPLFSPAAIERVSSFLHHELGITQGLSKHHPVIGEFEQVFAEFFDSPHCLGASSGHGALQTALIGGEITGGDHVLTSPYSWGASVACILHNDAVPVFADVDPQTGLLDPDRLGDYITPQTTAILVPHIFGQPADMTRIMRFAEERGLFVLEDGSQAHGAKHRGKRIGSFGDAAGFSTNGVKPIATTEGGFMLTKHENVYYRGIISAQHAGRGEMLGRASESGFPDSLRPFVDSIIYTFRPDVISSILALSRLEELDAENAVRRQQAADVRAVLDEVEYLTLPDHHEDDECVFHMVTMNFDAELAGISRDTMLRALQAEGVAAVGYVAAPLNKSPRLAPDWSGPRVMWTETMRRSGTDPAAAELPGCEEKVATSIELPWNIVPAQPEYIAQIAEAFEKVNAGIGSLRELDVAEDSGERARG